MGCAVVVPSSLKRTKQWSSASVNFFKASTMLSRRECAVSRASFVSFTLSNRFVMRVVLPFADERCANAVCMRSDIVSGAPGDQINTNTVQRFRHFLM